MTVVTDESDSDTYYFLAIFLNVMFVNTRCIFSMHFVYFITMSFLFYFGHYNRS